MVASILVAVVAVHALAVLIAGFLVVARNLFPDPPALQVRSDVKFPAKVRKHRMDLRQMEAARPKASARELLKSVHSLPFSLPKLPSTPARGSEAVVDWAAEFAEAAGGTVAGVGGSISRQNSFFGVETRAQRILILYDISKTVVNAAARASIPMETIRKESSRLLDGLGIQCRFGLAQFARNYAFFDPVLLPVSEENRLRAKEWLNRWFATTGIMPSSTPNLVSGSPGFLEVLVQAFRAEPQAVYIISDGGFYRSVGPIPYEEIKSTLHRLQQGLVSPVQIHFLAVGMKEDRFWEMRKILSPYGGTIQNLSAN